MAGRGFFYDSTKKGVPKGWTQKAERAGFGGLPSFARASVADIQRTPLPLKCRPKPEGDADERDECTI